jgi:hypothetical protein
MRYGDLSLVRRFLVLHQMDGHAGFVFSTDVMTMQLSLCHPLHVL